MEQEQESCCCREMDQVLKCMREEEERAGQDVLCITEHQGFGSVCLNIHVLDTAYLAYRQQYGALRNFRQDE